MLCIDSASAPPAQGRVFSAITPTRSHSAAAVSQNQTDIHLYLDFITTEASVLMVVAVTKTVTTPPASRKTVCVILLLVMSSLGASIHNLSLWMYWNLQGLGSKAQSVIIRKMWIQQSLMLIITEPQNVELKRKMFVKAMRKEAWATAVTRRQIRLLLMLWGFYVFFNLLLTLTLDILHYIYHWWC